MSEIPSLADRLAASTVKAENASQIMHDVANGGPATVVPTESGPVPSIQKWLAELNDRTSGAVGVVEVALEQEVLDRAQADEDHVSAADPHTQYLQKTDLPVATDAEMQEGVEDAPRRMSPRQVKLLASEAASVVVEEVTASKEMLPDVYYVVVAAGVTLSLPLTVAAGSRFSCMDASGAGFMVAWGAHTVKGAVPDSPMAVRARSGFTVVYSGSTFA